MHVQYNSNIFPVVNGEKLFYNLTMFYIGEEYQSFCSKNCNRRDFIVSYLEKRGVKSVILPIDGHEHIYVVFPKSHYSSMFRIKTVIAHYDRFEGSPGANDNSSAVFALMEWASKLMSSGMQHNVRLIFTDGEEISESQNRGVAEQGAFALAALFKRLKITDDDVYVFDSVGRGTVPVIGKTELPKNVSLTFKNKFIDLKNRTANLLRVSSGGSFVTLPISYSDNAGFLACGIPAIAVTMLPSEEVNKFMFDLVRVPVLENYVMNKKIPEYIDKITLEEMIPQTWKLFHTPADSVDSLATESFAVMERILFNLAKEHSYSN